MISIFKKKGLVNAVVLALSVILLHSCQREVEGTVPDIIVPADPAVNDNEMVTGGVNGIVVDENNRPVADATVRSGSNTTTTDRYGVFRFRNISLSKANGTVKVEKAGYFTGYRSFVSVSGRINNVRIKMLPKTNSGIFAASAGGTVNISGGAKLVLPVNAVTDAGGTAYSGTVNVAMTWIDPSSADLPYTVMGDLRGITTTGTERGLSTYGMIGVELTGSSGQSLKIASGKTAELTFPVPASLQTSAPATIDLWHFDEATARWKQEGTATKSGNNYIAQVSHFSFWNCDAPFPLIDLCMSFKDDDGLPLINAQVRIKRTVTGTYGYGRTDSSGNLCGKVPKNEALVLEVLDICNSVVYSQNIGPFSSNTTLPVVTVTIPAANSLIISGTVTNCAAANVTNGAAAIYVDGGHQYTVPVTNGTFSLSLMRCSSGTLNFSVLGVDYATLQQSVPVSGTGTTGTVNVGTLQACGTSSVQYIELMVDGSPSNLASPPDFLNYNDSTNIGAYTHKSWVFGYRQNSGTTSSAQISYLNNQAAANNLPLTSVSIGTGLGFTANQIITPSPTINITAFGPPLTGFVEGNFNIQMMFGTTPKNVVCNFRVRRN
ncbi:MAG: carboxypeptidase regulatory-like domain-containing protein [Chitinophagaceae bacterium]|nr:carboxypeptidase regulatory-like domain-containing protein [Chitinophagaceae bacterium]